MFSRSVCLRPTRLGTYGPRSAEAEDGLRRLDADLNRLLEALMSSVPRNKLWIVLTADHGVAELPEWRHEQRSLKCPEPSGRISYLDLGGAIFWGIYKHFSWPFGDPRDWVSLDGGHLVVNREKARAEGLTRATSSVRSRQPLNRSTML